MKTTAINLEGIVLSQEESAILAKLGLRAGKRRRKKVKEKKELPQPYTLEIQTTCKLCNSTETFYYLMERTGFACLAGRKVLSLKEKAMKVETRTTSSCSHCKENLLKLSKEELIKKIFLLK